MAFEVVNIHVAGPDATKTKQEMQKSAAYMHMSLSAFMMWLYTEWKKKEARKKN